MSTTAQMTRKGGNVGNDAQNDALLYANQPEKASGGLSKLDRATEKNGHKHIGDCTIITRNFKIADAIADYLMTTPKAKL